MIRKIIKIDEEKCNGCGLCADACHEGAIVMENNKILQQDNCENGIILDEAVRSWEKNHRKI